jgi:virginiamycin B lyase
MRRCGAVATIAMLAACSSSAGPAPAPPANHALAQRSGSPSYGISEYLIRRAGAGAQPFAIAAGRDGAMWFTEPGAGSVGRIDRAGVVRQYHLPTRGGDPEGIAAAPDGNLYVAEHFGPNYATHVARVTPTGRITEWTDSNFMPEGVSPGPDGSIWFTQGCAGLAILRRGKVEQYLISGITGETPAIVRGPDGAMWFSQDGTARIGRVGPEGKLRTYAGPLYQSEYNDVPNGVAVGSDGNLWWTAQFGNLIWAMNVRGQIVHEYAIPTPASMPWGIAAGRDGALWFTEWAGNKIGRVTTGGVFSEYPLPTIGAKPQGIASSRDGSLWFVESAANRIGRIEL